MISIYPAVSYQKLFYTKWQFSYFFSSKSLWLPKISCSTFLLLSYIYWDLQWTICHAERDSYAKKYINLWILNVGNQNFCNCNTFLFSKLKKYNKKNRNHDLYCWKVLHEVINCEMKSDTCFIKIITFFVFFKRGLWGSLFKSMLA